MRRNKHANYQSRIMNASIPIHSGQAGQGGYKQLISHLLVSKACLGARDDTPHTPQSIVTFLSHV